MCVCVYLCVATFLELLEVRWGWGVGGCARVLCVCMVSIVCVLEESLFLITMCLSLSIQPFSAFSLSFSFTVLSYAVDTNGMFKTTSVVCEFQPHKYETHS